MTKQLHWTKWI